MKVEFTSLFFPLWVLLAGRENETFSSLKIVGHAETNAEAIALAREYEQQHGNHVVLILEAQGRAYVDVWNRREP